VTRWKPSLLLTDAVSDDADGEEPASELVAVNNICEDAVVAADGDGGPGEDFWNGVGELRRGIAAHVDVLDAAEPVAGTVCGSKRDVERCATASIGRDRDAAHRDRRLELGIPLESSTN
jgi:hypothetical protein